MQYAQAAQIEPSSPKHLPFDEFQAIHLSLHLTITPRRREGGADRRVVAANALRKAFEFGEATVFGLDKPCICNIPPAIA